MSKNKDHGPLSRRDIHEKSIEEHIERINREFKSGFEFLKKYPRSVSVFGSSMATPESEHYKQAYELGKAIVSNIGYTVITGGGPGIMEAANKGAFEAGGKSVGIRINLLRERSANPYETDGIDFTYFFARKTMLTFAAETYVFFPGGFGTFDELFSILTLVQTAKIPRVPIVLFDSKFWGPLKELVEKTMYDGYHTIDHPDLNLFEITDSVDRVIEIIRKAPVSEWWRNIN